VEANRSRKGRGIAASALLLALFIGPERNVFAEYARSIDLGESADFSPWSVALLGSRLSVDFA
jgi:hypothetical protein